MNKTALTYDDIQLIPQYSDVLSRSNIDLETRLTRNHKIKLPYIASCMDTVCESDMVIRMNEFGATGAIHRFMSPEDQFQQMRQVALFNGFFSLIPIIGTIGVNDDAKRRAEIIHSHTDIFLIDVAHGDHLLVRDMIFWLKENFPDRDVIAGNIATAESASNLCEWGADALRVGIGSGALCSTRIMTGHGVPMITSIEDVVSVADTYNVPVIADGGIRTPGDVAKAIAAGADSVMLGSILAGTQESPGDVIENADGSLRKRYRGSASLDMKISSGGNKRNVEGVSTTVPYKGGVKFVIDRLNDGLRSALSYSGAHSISEFHRKVEYNVVTHSGIIEATPHGLK